MTTPRPSGASMVERMTLILDVFEGRADRLRLDEIAADAGLPRSSCHRILEQLVRLSWLRHTPDGYALGQRALQLGGGIGDHQELRAAGVPLLQELHEQTGHVVQLGVLDFAEVVHLDKISGLDSAALPSRVGSRSPAHAVAMGKAMLAWLTPEETDALFHGGLGARTHTTITDLMVLHEELRRVRSRHGLAFDHDEHVQGISSVASAVRGPEGAVAGVSLSVPTGNERLEALAPRVLEVSRRISRRMFPDLSVEDMPSTVWADGMMERILNLIDDDAIM